MNITENIHLLRTAAPGRGSETINAYLFKSSQGSLLVDTGWNQEKSEDMLTGQLHEAGVALDDVRMIVITHTHPDHFGMVHRLAGKTGAQLVIHEKEQGELLRRAEDYESVLEEMAAWLEAHGMPGDRRSFFDAASLAALGLAPAKMPTRTVQGGERLSLGEFEFEVLWTPGHAPGHVCLYEANRKLLVAGDHVLPGTTPNVSMYSETMGNPLAQYLGSLEKVRQLDAELVLPSHGEPFQGLAERVDAIVQHHEERLAGMKTLLAGGEQTARQVAEATPWVNGTTAWAELRSFARQMALTETVAHLEFLVYRNEAVRTFREGRYRYSTA